MLSKLTPYKIFDKFDDITPEYLSRLGVRFLFSDVDNTLAPYETPEPDERIRAWLDSLKASGIQVILVSNNHPERIKLFNRTLGLPAFPDAKKPGKKVLAGVMAQLGAAPENCAFLGDQILTDVLCARNLGITLALLVPPIKDKLTLFFRFKRALERPVIKHYYKINK